MRYAHLSDDPLGAGAARFGATIAEAGSPADNLETFPRRRESEKPMTKAPKAKSEPPDEPGK